MSDRQFKGGLLGLERRLLELEQVGDVTVGFQGRSGMKRHPNAGGTVAGIATLMEFGTKPHGDHPGTPEYAFMRRALDQAESGLGILWAASIKDVVDGRRTAKSAMSNVGEAFAEEVVRQIDSSRSWAPPNRPVTVDNKDGRDTPLRDTLTLRNSVSYAFNGDPEVIVR